MIYFQVMIKVKRFERNNRGRDFVVGDIHGCLFALERLLEMVDFDTSKDRLFSVGDLIDRGPDPLGVVGLIEKGWFYPVKGNHEVMIVDFFRRFSESGGRDFYSTYLLYEGGWIFDVLNDSVKRGRLYECLELIESLPLVITVESENRFNVVHAELIKEDEDGKYISVYGDEDIDNEFAGLSHGEYVMAERNMVWSRKLMEYAGRGIKLPARVKWLSDTYCGHTVHHTVRRVFSHICIDTGVYMPLRFVGEYDYGLTMMEPATGRSWHINTLDALNR